MVVDTTRGMDKEDGEIKILGILTILGETGVIKDMETKGDGTSLQITLALHTSKVTAGGLLDLTTIQRGLSHIIIQVVVAEVTLEVMPAAIMAVAAVGTITWATRPRPLINAGFRLGLSSCLKLRLVEARQADDIVETR